jgi:hypothetical protein
VGGPPVSFSYAAPAKLPTIEEDLEKVSGKFLRGGGRASDGRCFYLSLSLSARAVASERASEASEKKRALLLPVMGSLEKEGAAAAAALLRR